VLLCVQSPSGVLDKHCRAWNKSTVWDRCSLCVTECCFGTSKIHSQKLNYVKQTASNCKFVLLLVLPQCTSKTLKRLHRYCIYTYAHAQILYVCAHLHMETKHDNDRHTGNKLNKKIMQNARHWIETGITII